MTESEQRILLLDLDGTVADYEGALCAELERMRSPAEPAHDFWAETWPDHIRARAAAIKNRPGFWRELPAQTLGLDVYAAARTLDFEIHVLTKGPAKASIAWTEKLEWVRAHLDDDVKVTITEDKGLVYGRVLVDDHPGYIERWLAWRPRGTVIMPASSGNAGFRHPQVLRYDGANMAEMRAALEEA